MRLVKTFFLYTIKYFCYDDFEREEALTLTVGEKIHALRIKNNMTMDDLARELGVQRSAINKYEKGIVVNLKRSTISALCRVFGVSPSYFLDENTPAPVESSAPQTLEARIVSGGMDKLPQEQREQILNVVRAMFIQHPELFNNEEGTKE